jgi:hypothetical protein
MAPSIFASKAVAVLAILGACAFAAPPANARVWNASPKAKAMDYLQIIDEDGTSFRMVLWYAAPLAPNGPVRQLLDQYVILAISDSAIHANGIVTFVTPASVEAWGADEKKLVALADNDIPPTIQGAMVTLRGVLNQSLGAAGHNVELLVFDPGSVRACGQGKLSVAFDGKTYTYDTPVPGCQEADAAPVPPDDVLNSVEFVKELTGER